MRAEDTVMNEVEQIKVARECWKSNKTYPELLIGRQAEISFKAGIKEVVDWVDSDLEYSSIWQSKKKEWGIE